MVKKVNGRKLTESTDSNNLYYFKDGKKNTALYKEYVKWEQEPLYYVDCGWHGDTLPDLKSAIEAAKHYYEEYGEPSIILEQKYSPLCYYGDEDACNDVW